MSELENNKTSYDNFKTLGKNIRNIRLSMGYTMEDVASQLDLSHPYIGLIERGERCPSLHTLMRICNIFSLTPNDLIYGDYQLNSLSKKSRQNKIQALETILNQFSDAELDFFVSVTKQISRLRIGKIDTD